MKSKRKNAAATVALSVLLTLSAAWSFLARFGVWQISTAAFAGAILFVIGIWLYRRKNFSTRRFATAYAGARILTAFLLSATTLVVWAIISGIRRLPDDWSAWLTDTVIAAVCETVFFWIGILCVYFTSTQLGIRMRVIGALVGMIPILHLIALVQILRIVFCEVRFEAEKEQKNRERQDERICRTRYPILLVHGVFFRDSKKLNYWGRIPAELERNGATVYYGNHESATPVSESGKELADRIREIVRETGCEKVNIIAHSKGGLDCRYAIANCGIAENVASLTTVNTPHRGCVFAEAMLGKASGKLKESVAKVYRSVFIRFGDQSPNFLLAVEDLTAKNCRAFNEVTPTPEGVFCQSIGSRMTCAKGEPFPLNISFPLVSRYDGENDGLVGTDSFRWGERVTYLEPVGKKGITHGDVIDLYRRNLVGFDVREFYVKLVEDLKKRGF